MLAAVSDPFALLAEETQLCVFALLKPQILKTERMCTCECILFFDLNRKPQKHPGTRLQYSSAHRQYNSLHLKPPYQMVCV